MIVCAITEVDEASFLLKCKASHIISQTQIWFLSKMWDRQVFLRDISIVSWGFMSSLYRVTHDKAVSNRLGGGVLVFLICSKT